MIWLYEPWVFFVELEQRLLKGRQLEKIVLFSNRFSWASAFRAVISRICLVDVQFVVYAILAAVGAFIDVTVALAALE